MTRLRDGYLKRLHARREATDLKRQILFGIGVGWILALYSAFQYLFVIGANDPLWRVLMYVGFGVILIALVVPTACQPVERAWMWAGGWIGRIVFGAVLTMVYLVVVAPLGLLLRWRKGSHPFYSWAERPRDGAEGWIPKEILEEDRTPAIGGLSLPLVLPVRVMGYFAQAGLVVYLPLVFVLLSLALVMFFASTSALAPFIYTLF